MNELERMKLLSSARKLKEREETPEPFADPYSDMTPDEKSKMIIELMAARERERTLPVLSWLIWLSTNMFLTPLFIVKCTGCRVSQCI